MEGNRTVASRDALEEVRHLLTGGQVGVLVPIEALANNSSGVSSGAVVNS